MAQGFTKNDTAITIKDSANLDAFSRLRVSNPLTILSNQFTYGLTPLVFEQVPGTGGTITHDTTNRQAIINTAGNVGNSTYMQSFEYIPYQPGRSQLVFITFNLFPSGSAVAGSSQKFVGLSELTGNGFMFRSDGTASGTEFLIQSTTSAGNQAVNQNSWNLDKLNGSGKSGYTLDLTKIQILVIDLQALYAGRVRFGFDINGKIIYAHEFLNANNLSSPYIATANLPIIAGIKEQSALADKMDFICCSVASEGGLDDSQRFGYNFSKNRAYSTLPATSTYVMSLRPKTTFNGFVNRAKFILDGIDIVNAGNKPIFWQLGIGGVLNTPTYTDVNSTYSTIEVDIAGTSASGLSVVIDSGYVASGGGSKSVGLSEAIQSKYPITLNAAGAHRDLGTLRLFANGEGGTSDLYVTLKWKEIR